MNRSGLINSTGEYTLLPMRILIIDDDPDVLGLTEQILRAVGHRTERTESVEGAIAAWEGSRGGFEMVLVDYTLPGRSGVDLIEIFRGETADLPVVLMTGFDVELPGNLAKSVEVLPKPFSVAKLRAVVARIEAALAAGR